MVFVSGRAQKLLRDSEGDLKGMVLDNGREIRFSAALGHHVAPMVKEGCLVEIEGRLESEDSPTGCVQATVVKNLDSRKYASLPAPKREGKPGMQSEATPTDAASLEHPHADGGDPPNDRGEWSKSDRGAPGPNLPAEDSTSFAPGSFFHRLLRENGGKAAELSRNDSARSIGIAYDSLHRIQAILAYLHIIKHRVPGIGQFLDEAKHTYEQALARFAAGDYTGAKEFAEASGSLSRVVEIVMARTLRSDDSLPSLVPPPPEHPSTAPEPEHVAEDMAQAENVLSRIHWLLENGTLPSEDRAQVRKLASWGDAFYRQAQRTYRDAILEDAAEFAQAALAGAYSAEHVCRKWYVSHP